MSTINSRSSKPVLVYTFHSLENVVGLARFRVFVPNMYVRVRDDYRTQTNRELYTLFNDVDVAKRFGLLGHVVRMDDDDPPRRVFDAVVGGYRRKGRLRTHWKDQVEEALTQPGVNDWSTRAQAEVPGEKL